MSHGAPVKRFVCVHCTPSIATCTCTFTFIFCLHVLLWPLDGTWRCPTCLVPKLTVIIGVFGDMGSSFFWETIWDLLVVCILCRRAILIPVWKEPCPLYVAIPINCDKISFGATYRHFFFEVVFNYICVWESFWNGCPIVPRFPKVGSSVFQLLVNKICLVGIISISEVFPNM